MEYLLAHCGSVFSQDGGLFAVFFLGGLTGSVTHCLVMCGPLVSCQSACAASCGNSMNARFMWRYHLGRFLTYGVLGFLVAYFGKYLASYSFWPMLSAFMLVAAGLLFIASSLKPIAHHFVVQKNVAPFLKGLLMGFMPCGLLYAALMVAATLNNPLSGLIAMWLFALGTMPVLLAASMGASRLTHIWAGTMDKVGRLVMFLSGASLITTAYRLMR